MTYWQIRFFICVITIIFLQEGFAQKVKITFTATHKNKFLLEQCKFYLSDFSLIHGTQSIYQEKDSVHLINLLDTEKNYIEIPYHKLTETSAVEFGIGVDSATHWNGIKGGDLDPINGMYWTWQTGYINFKLEAKKSEEKSERKTEYHIGGFIHPFNSFKKVNIKLPTNQRKDLVICFDTDKFLSSVQEEIPESVMTPGKKSMRIAEIYSTCFQIE